MCAVTVCVCVCVVCVCVCGCGVCVTCSYSLESVLAQCTNIVIGNNRSTYTCILLSGHSYFTDTE